MVTRVMASSEAIVARLRAAGCVFAADEAALLSEAAGSPDELESMVAARVGGLPLEQVVGWAEFRGLRILVDPGVFVPRRRSEFLVETALALTTSPGDTGTPPATNPARLTDPRPARSWVNSEPMMSLLTHDHESRGTTPSGEPDISGISRATAPVVVDLCCGSGALGVAAAAGLASAELHAADLDPAAVACARRNVEPAGGHVYEGDLFAPLPARLRSRPGQRGRVAFLICNAPYVPTNEIAFMPPEARDHEARMALDGGADGLAVLRRAAAEAPGWLAPGGVMLVETSGQQAGSMVKALTSAGLLARVHHDDEMGATVVSGMLPGPGESR